MLGRPWAGAALGAWAASWRQGSRAQPGLRGGSVASVSVSAPQISQTGDASLVLLIRGSLGTLDPLSVAWRGEVATLSLIFVSQLSGIELVFQRIQTW